MNYDAFISYSHAKDKAIAATLQAAIQKLGKPWYARRALRIFRDDSSLSATPHLWPTIEQALSGSRYFILLASAESAKSPWVDKEVAHWLERNSIDTVLIGLTDGALTWDAAAKDFAAGEGFPLVPALAGKFPNEPRWVDLRQYRADARKGDIKFTELAADFAAAIRGVPKEDLLSAELRQQRRALRLAVAAASLLLVLGSAAGWQWYETNVQRAEAVKQRDQAEKNLKGGAVVIDDMASLLTDVVRLQALGQATPENIQRQLELANVLLNKFSIETMDREGRTQQDPIAFPATLSDEFADVSILLNDKKGANRWAEQSVLTREYLVKFKNTPGCDMCQIDFGRTDIAKADDLARALLRYGDTQKALDKISDALATYRRALDVGRQMFAFRPADIHARGRYMLALRATGELLAASGPVHDASSALAIWRESLAAARRVSDSDPENLDWRKWQADSLSSIADLMAALNAPGGAVQARREVVDVARLIAAREPNATASQMLISDLWDLGSLLRSSGTQQDLPGALAVFREMTDDARKMSTRDPGNVVWQKWLAQSLFAQGDVLSLTHDTAEAVKLERDGLQIARQVAAKDPDDAALQINLVMSLQNLADNGDDPRTRLNEELGILQRLKARNALSADKAGWIGTVQKQLAGLLLWSKPSLYCYDAQHCLDPQNTVLLDTSFGRVVIKLRPDLAPLHVEYMKDLIRVFYTTNDLSCDTVGLGLVLSAARFAPTKNRVFLGGPPPAQKEGEPLGSLLDLNRTTVLMDTNKGAEYSFFVVTDSWLGSVNYSHVGDVVSGMEAIDRIKAHSACVRGIHLATDVSAGLP